MAKTKRKAKRQPSAPATPWDMGPNTAAQRHLKVVEPVEHFDERTGKKVTSPNGVKRARRCSMAEHYVRQGWLTERQGKAAQVLLNAWERNLRTAPAIKAVQVDTSPKPDAHIAIQIDRVSAYHRVVRLVPAKYRAFVLHVACDDRALSAMPGYRRNVYMERLGAGLDGLADALELS
ncbi:hypothetical protein [Tropicimonas sp. IMCC34011]|uniref:hypothetical protein n=1 Tax=Tropicimonas sp. IMCC34011 TaxID=2248759 RepID=UPI000E25116A|nr:hypothetical protein [Tropicimonas sp. IMCC34011]